MKRWRTPSAKPGELKIAYGKEYADLDVFYCHGAAGADKCDSRLLSYFFEGIKGYDGLNLREELVRRGYDITTIKFSIQQKKGETD